MTKRIMFGGLLLLLAASCGGDSKDVDKENGDGGSKTNPVKGGGGSSGSSSSSSSGGSSGSSSSSSSSSDGGPGSSTAGNNSSSGGGSGGSSSTPGGGTAPTDGSQLAQCTRTSDCNDGLNCYTFGRYCSAACATDADCASLGSGYTCNARMTTGGVPGGGGAFPGGGMMGADAAAPMPTGTCRLECTGTSDTSCPSGMSCVSVGGGFTGGGFPGGMGGDAGTATMGTFRCQYPMQAPMGRDGGTPTGRDGGTGMMMGAGDTPAFGQCSDDSDCSDGLNCTAGRTSSGYCAETCMMTGDCTMMPASGTATPTCGAGGNCTLSCAAMGSTCPDGMTCVRLGGGGGPMGGGGTATCNYARTGTMPGGGFPGGGG